MRRLLALIALATAGAPSISGAQPPPDPPPTTLTIRPAAQPSPALKYRLVPERIAQVPGNAAIFYHRAIQMMSERRNRMDAERKEKPPTPGLKPEPVFDQIYNWVTGPIGEIPIEPARQMVASFQYPLKEVEQGATRSDCDWEFDRRPEGINLLLPEIQEIRQLSRLVAIKARLAILDGQTDEAMHWIETGLVMGRHVAEGPIIIQALVGIAIDNVTLKCLEDLIQAPGTPSLYWALADRPRPFIGMRQAFDGERSLLEKEVPGLLELDKSVWGIDQAQKFADELQRKLYSFDSGRTEGSTAQRFGIAAMTAKIYPKARRALIAQGRPEAAVDAMPVVQVASLYCYREYRRLLDEKYKWMNLPHWQSVGRVDRAIFSAEDKRANPLLAMLWSLTPALEASRVASVRLERMLDALQCVEAIRLDAQAHGGALPASLEAITEAPPPLDPATNKPFLYKKEGDTATLSAPIPPGFPSHGSYAVRYVLKLAK